MEGWIKIHRKILNRGRYSDNATRSVFFHLLLIANHKPNVRKGITISSGQCIIGRKTLSVILGLTEAQIRRALLNLKTTNEITTKTTNRFSLITLLKRDEYQSEENKTTNKRANKTTNKQPTNNQQTTTPKECNNDNNENNNTSTIVEEEQSSLNLGEMSIWDMDENQINIYKQELNEKVLNGTASADEIKRLNTIEINECLEIIKKHNGGIIDGIKEKQRIYGKHLINKIKGFDPVKSGKFTWQTSLDAMLKIISENEYHCSKIGGPESIYHNLGSLHQICKTSVKENKNQPKTMKQF